jgi:large subunit ribosomal protein L24
MSKAKFKLKKGDKVVVLAGKDKGKTGEIKQVLTEDLRVVVSGVNVQTRHKKPTARNAGGLIKIEAPIHISNVALADPKSGKATRVGFKIDGDKKVRIARKSGSVVG